MAQQEEFLQVWDYILDNDELDLTDVLLLSKVISLHATKDGCYMTNDYICKMLRLKNIETASRRINKLEKMGYVELKYIPLPTNAKKTRRFIIPTYENGLTQKSSRVDLKVNTPLTTESIPLDFKVNTPLTPESTPPCLESQSIISVDNINENISEIHKLEHINELDNQISLEEELEQISIQLDLIKHISTPEVNETRGELERKKYEIKKQLKELV
jgi:hypothetical protein